MYGDGPAFPSFVPRDGQNSPISNSGMSVMQYMAIQFAAAMANPHCATMSEFDIARKAKATASSLLGQL